MRARLVSGEVVELKKGCTCMHHDGPHWLYMNDWWHASNRKLLDRGNVMRFVNQELARLEEKGHEIRCRSIAEIIRDEPQKEV